MRADTVTTGTAPAGADPELFYVQNGPGKSKVATRYRMLDQIHYGPGREKECKRAAAKKGKF